MPYCKSCGEEIEEGVSFCPRCGAPVGVAAVEYRAARRGWGAGRIAALVIGVLIIIVSFPLLVGGGGILFVQGRFSDAEGFLTTPEFQFQAESRAIVFQHLDITVDESVPPYLWSPRPRNFVTIKIVGTSNDPSKQIFMGIGAESDVQDYLNNVNYDEVTRFEDIYNPMDGPPRITYRNHPGTRPPQPPASEAFWVASATGTGARTLEWEPEAGTYWVVVMNADASVEVDADMRFGARVPILGTIGYGLLFGGVVALLLGAIVLYFGAIRGR